MTTQTAHAAQDSNEFLVHLEALLVLKGGDESFDLNPLAAKWLEATSMLEGWDGLSIGGGLALEAVHHELELLMLADTAPNDLLFGLAYGKLVDAIEFRSAIRTVAHPVVMTMGGRSPIHNALLDRVLERGHRLSIEAESAMRGEDADDAFELEGEDEYTVPFGKSRAPIDELMAHLDVIRTPFQLGQLTSWILTNHRLNHPEQYAYLLNTAAMGGVTQEMMQEYCQTSLT